MATLRNILEQLQALSQPARKAGMARYGIEVAKAFGVTIPELRKLAKTIGKNHALAQELWDSGFHEARLLASMIADPKLVTAAQMDAWANAFDSWDVCDQCVTNLFWKTPYAFAKAVEWNQCEPEFVKRAGFVLMAVLAVHAKQADDQTFEAFFPFIEQAAQDARNYVKKAINWALRQIGKRNLALNHQAIAAAKRIQAQGTASAKWIAADAVRELSSAKIQAHVQKRQR